MTRVLDSTGLTVQTLDETRDALAADIHASSQFGASTNVGDHSVVGEILDTMAVAISTIDELLQALYDSFDANNAEGVELDRLCTLCPGITRNPATYSVVTLTLTGTPSTVIAAGKRARVDGGTIFALDEEATIGGGGTVDAVATATESGPLEAATGSVTTIVDAVSGWTGVDNAADATLGVEQESDADLRLRREQSFSLAGNGTDQALRAALLELDDVTNAIVISNRTGTVDSYGIPPGGFRCVVWPILYTVEQDEHIVTTIYNHLVLGSYPDGGESYNVTDSQGYTQTIRFQYATAQEIYLNAVVTTKTGYPTNGDDLVKAALLAYGNALDPGDNVEPDFFEAYVLTGSSAVAGIAAITVQAKIGSAPGSGDTVPIEIGLTEIARFDSSRITVSS